MMYTVQQSSFRADGCPNNGNKQIVTISNSAYISPDADKRNNRSFAFLFSGNIVQRVLLSFSFVTNGAKLLSAMSQGEDNIQILHGFRFYSMVLVIFGHAISMADSTLTLREFEARPSWSLLVSPAPLGGHRHRQR